MPLPEYGGTLGLKRAAHLLRRATFGATKQQIDQFSNLTPAQAIQQLYVSNLPAPVLPIDPKTGQEWLESGVTPANSRDFELENFFLGWVIGQFVAHGVNQNQSLAYSARERLVYFLHTHFTTIKSKVSSSRALYYQNQLLRQFALDGLSADPLINFKTLTVKISVDNAMLRLLDGNLNVRGSVNENYSRELHELYSIGRGLEGNVGTTPSAGDYIVFTEDDIRAAARVLSGWDFDDTFSNIDPDTNLPRGKVKGSPTNATAHDNGEKQFSNRFNNNVIQPDPLLLNGSLPTEESALDEIRQLVDQIYASPETARNICRKIYRFFVWAPHTLDETLPLETSVIDQMVDVFVSNNYKILPVIQNLLRSQHFYEAAGGLTDDNFGAMIKSPLDVTLGSLRFFDIQFPDMINDATNFYAATGEIIGSLEAMGMHFFEPYDVAGYEAYHQYPVYHRYWITPNSLTRRYEFVRNVISQMEPGMFKANVYDFVKNNFAADAPDVRNLVTALARYIFPVTDNLDFDDATDSGLTAKRLNYFKDALLQQLSNNNEAYWTQRWNEQALDLRDQLEYLFNAMMQSPEYQLA